MENIEILNEFVELAYHKGQNKTKTLHDLPLGDLTILRVDSRGQEMIRLLNGSRVFIPWIWTDLFVQFREFSLRPVVSCPEDKINHLVWLLSKLFSFRVGHHLDNNNGEYVSFLADICEIGPKKLIDRFPFLEPFTISLGELERQI